MPTSIITTDDLRDFKMELLDDIKNLLAKQATGKLKKYLKSSEVMDLLQVSPGTLQNLRINGTLP
ncbi:MAG: DNA-binding protein, partial [Maribacter stanieri]